MPDRSMIWRVMFSWLGTRMAAPPSTRDYISPLNPIPAYILPSYLQTALSWWIEDGMPEDIGG